MAISNYLSHQPSIGQGVYIAPTASVIGKVKIGEQSSIWPGAVVRGDVNQITIGKHTNIQDNSVLHVTHDGPYTPGGVALVIGDHVTVGHQVTLHACQIHDASLIGIGSIVLDEVVVESQVMVGAGSLVPPGKILTSGYLWMGSPVKQIRPLTDKEKAFFKYSAKHYQKLKDQYLQVAP